jgi:diaminohydroxyphosphoribosylaminopyrimidine deaminase / 5-amino-6-(5-phosphoribosylamino)uracil reductase
VITPDDVRHMRRALELAHRGLGGTWPNPMVGAVVVRAGEVVGEGFHAQCGGPHAEVVALGDAGEAARGATLYVTLEPCSHHGRTPPCTDAVISAGIARVVYAAADPNPTAAGGAEQLRRGGVAVIGGVEREAARSVNAAFFAGCEGTEPFVALKLATSIDGAIAAAPGERTQLTGAAAAGRTHRLRAHHDAIVVGVGTARIDDPLLTVRGISVERSPARVVVDTHASLPLGSQLVRTVEQAPLVLFCAEDAAAERVEALQQAGVTVHLVPREGARLDLAAALAVLAAADMRAVLVEGGAALATALIERGLADRIYLFIAPRFLGAGAVPAFRVATPTAGWRPVRVERLDADTLITFDPAAMPAETH